MNLALWIAQGLLAAMFLMAGIMKTTQPKEKLEASLPWVKDYSLRSVRLIGAAEGLAALGLVLPWATGIAPILTPIAAIGLVVIMIGAAVYHLRHDEKSAIGFNVILLALAAFVAVGRLVG